MTALYDEFIANGIVRILTDSNTAALFSQLLSNSGHETLGDLSLEWKEYWLNPTSSLCKLLDAIFHQNVIVFDYEG